MKTLRCLSLVVVIVILLIYRASVAGTIKVSAAVTNSSAVKGHQITVPVIIDISDLPEKLGSFTAVLNWDAQVLKYINHNAGTTAGFTTPVVNTENTSQGNLAFAAVNPRGADGIVNILNVVFEIIGTADFSYSLDLEFSAMAAAYTYADLLPYVETEATGKEHGKTVRELPEEVPIFQNNHNSIDLTSEIRYQLPRSEKDIELRIFYSSDYLSFLEPCGG